MTARTDDWDTLSAEWRAAPADAPAAVDTLRGVVNRRRRELQFVFAGEIALTVVSAGAVIRTLVSGLTRGTIAVAVMVLATMVIVWTFTIWNRRSVWRPMAETTAEYLRLSRRRIVAGRRSLRFVQVCTGIYFLAYGPWFVIRVSRHLIDPGERVRWIAAAAYGVGLIVWSVMYARRLTSDLGTIESIDRSLGLDEAA